MFKHRLFLVIFVILFTSCAGCRTRPDLASVKDSEVQSQIAFTIVSDVDDTVKITNTTEKDQAVSNGIFGETVFPGMDTLYRKLVRQMPSRRQGASEPPQIVYVSGSPPLLHHKIKELLFETNHFPSGEIHLRPFWPLPTIAEFKASKFEKFAVEGDQKFLFVGDDTEDDGEVFENFATTVPGRGRAIARYIHVVTGKSLPPGSTPFNTAFDIAALEYKAGRLAEHDVVDIGNEVLKAAKLHFELLFPGFVKCPDELTSRFSDGSPAVLHQIDVDLIAIVKRKCQERPPAKG